VTGEGVATVNEPTPEEAAAALRAVNEGRERVIKSAVGSRSLSIAAGFVVFLYSAANDLFPTTRTWLGWPLVALVLVLAFGVRTRVGSTLLGQPVSPSFTFKSRLLRIAPIFGIGIGVALVIMLFHLPHGPVYYGALAGLYIMFLGPRFQQWLLRRQGKD
jgi:hypothetical protein